MSREENAVVLLSGGLDSTVLTYWVKERYTKVYPLYINYGSTHQPREFAAAQRTCKELGLVLERVDVQSNIFRGAALTDAATEIPNNLSETIKVVVPFRNTLLLTFGAAYADAVDASVIAASPTKEDFDVFRDCRREFFDSLEGTLTLGAKYEQPYQILTPFINYTKEEIIGIGVTLDVLFSNTWSCYTGGEVPCQTCPACRVRQKGFAFANVPDPLLI